MTVRELIKSSLRLIGAISSSESASADEQADALVSLNDLLESWSTEGLMINEYAREVFVLTPGKSQYTFGLTGNFNSARPMKIHQASSTIPNIVVTELTPFIPADPGPPPVPAVPATYRTDVYSNQEYPVQILNIQEWAMIGNKDTSSSYVTKIYCEGSSPLEKINVWPIPDVANGLVLYSQKALKAFASANDVITLPPGYTRALRYNLAVEIAPEYGKDVSQLVVQAAMESKAALSRINTQPVYMKSDAQGLIEGKVFNYLTGE